MNCRTVNETLQEVLGHLVDGVGLEDEGNQACDAALDQILCGADDEDHAHHLANNLLEIQHVTDGLHAVVELKHSRPQNGIPLLSGRNSIVVLADEVVVGEVAVKLGMILMEIDLRDNRVTILADQGTIF